MSAELHEAVQLLRDGGIICHACEGVWGFACDPFNALAVRRILQVKRRPQSKGLIVIANEAAQFEPELAQLSSEKRIRIEKTWPGPTTWLLPTTRFPAWIVGDNTTVAARVPGHEQAREIAAMFKHPIVSTSANIANEPPCLTESEAREKFESTVDYVVPGAIAQSTGPSEIFDAISGHQIR
ncbi:MAG: L-threonylcarbamoyladenylate synthase [Gammaproteobacteria bacterium]|nr:L-threonylcarbamoyladenylate synthase [Gammaproteobacteria bacterium]